METSHSVVLSFGYVKSYGVTMHSNETLSAALLHGTICFSVFCKMKFGFLLEYVFVFGTLGS